MSEIILESKIINDEYTEFIYNAFDIQNKELTTTVVNFDLKEGKNFDWNIGVILGSSGSGKSTILNRMGEIKIPEFSRDKALISNFDWMTPKDASRVLTSMGLSSVPTWLRPYHALSNGEQYRAQLAYLVSSAKEGEVILIDEYTSVVDRDVAKAMSYALSKYIRRENKRIILASCHYDILEWLTPDWSCVPEKGGVLERGDWLRCSRPKIHLQISRVESETWNLFKRHHYLTEEVNKSCKFFLFEWNNKPVGIIAMINQPGAGERRTAMAISRLVVLPDYQGLGIGAKIAEKVSAIFKSINSPCYIKTVNPALGEYFSRSSNWEPTVKNGISRGNDIIDKKAINRKSRPSYCYKYVGEELKGYNELLLPIKEMRDKKLMSLTV